MIHNFAGLSRFKLIVCYLGCQELRGSSRFWKKKLFLFVDWFCWILLSTGNIWFDKHFVRVFVFIRALFFFCEIIHSLLFFSSIFHKVQNNRSHQPFIPEQKKREFWNLSNIPSNIMMADFSFRFCFRMICLLMSITQTYLE